MGSSRYPLSPDSWKTARLRRPVNLTGEPSRENGILLALRYARTQAFAAVVLLTLALVFLLDGAALASALAVEGALLAYLVRPSESDDAAMKLAGRCLITAKSWLLLAFAALYSLVTVAWRATNPFGATGTVMLFFFFFIPSLCSRWSPRCSLSAGWDTGLMPRPGVAWPPVPACSGT